MGDPQRVRYRILALLGSGGFGNVYRARLESDVGFTKEVAIKVIREDGVTTADLARFRDEARILGLARDRALVVVEAPVRLDGRWAIVMELVDGVSLDTLIQLGPVPPGVALQVVGEVARALHKVYHQPGPDGEPLHIVHHDLKPSNLQITPDGDVKLLDFGVARARFASREAQTTRSIGGTVGFIAPERLLGDDGPNTDVYSLGVLLQVALTGTYSYDEAALTRSRGPGWSEVVALSIDMRAADPVDRPTAAEVELRCAELAERLGGPSLRRWAADHVAPSEAVSAADPLIGGVLSDREVSATFVHPGTAPPSTRPQPALRLGAGLVLVGLVALLAFTVPAASGVTAALLWWARHREEAVSPAPPLVIPAPAPDPEPPAVVAPAPRPRPAPRRPEPARPPVAAEPEAPPVVAEPQPPAPSLTAASFDSVPTGALVILDGISIGRTPLTDHPVSVGDHRLSFQWDGQPPVAAREIRIGGRHGKQRFTWEDGGVVAR